MLIQISNTNPIFFFNIFVTILTCIIIIIFHYYFLELCMYSKADRVVDTFDETPLMSTYLVAFVVSDFKSVKEIGEKVNVWGRPDIVSKGELAETVATTVLESLFMETGHAYDLPKLDLIGIPDFSMGAMENWGLVTFR